MRRCIFLVLFLIGACQSNGTYENQSNNQSNHNNETPLPDPGFTFTYEDAVSICEKLEPCETDYSAILNNAETMQIPCPDYLYYQGRIAMLDRGTFGRRFRALLNHYREAAGCAEIMAFHEATPQEALACDGLSKRMACSGDVAVTCGSGLDAPSVDRCGIAGLSCLDNLEHSNSSCGEGLCHDPDFAECQENLLVRCEDGIRITKDCRVEESRSIDFSRHITIGVFLPYCDAQKAQCVGPAEGTACVSEAEYPYCDGAFIFSCVDGIEVARDCRNFDPDFICRIQMTADGSMRVGLCMLPDDAAQKRR